ncbi:glycoside hydrolase family 5 protein [Shimwellia pseudoproteus]|uniref:cellulase family glycosylhydrolase n=1 Tax=Shimwellia pseudoproteus TaxID=570012 RepID=UPI0018ECEC60|nr:glycoside hydrolase family 5 protein [Shimwellia pseudoproteus]
MLLGGLSASALAQQPVPLPPPGAVSGYVSTLGTGMVVDWALTDRGIREFDPLAVRDFQQRGIHHVRIRVAADTSSQHLVHLHKIVEACEQYGIVPIISYQADAFHNEPDAENEAGLVRWWSAVANSFAGQSPDLAFDLIYDPGDKLSRNPQLLNRAYEKLVKAIHKISPDRVIMIAPRMHGAPEDLSGLKWPAGNNGVVFAEWHIFPWGPVKNNGKYPWTTGTAVEKAAIRARIHAVVRWQQKTGHRAWLGAWSAGEIAKKASLQNPIAFATFVACELQKAHIPYAINPDSWFYDGEEGAWRPEKKPLLDAMIGPDCSTPAKVTRPSPKPGHDHPAAKSVDGGGAPAGPGSASSTQSATPSPS